MTNDTDPPCLLDDLSQEFLDRQRRGENVTVKEYTDSHPDLADEIRQYFPTILAMEKFKLCNVGSSDGNVDLQLEPFHQLGDYRILREIGRGGMGVVYEAEQQSLQRTVAVKVFPVSTLREPRQLQRFHREARTAARLHHNNIVPVFGVGEQDGLHYFVMQKIAGTSLDRLIVPDDQGGSRTRLSESLNGLGGERHRNGAVWDAIAEIGIQVADALAYAHTQGVVHRDIKPSNLVLDGKGTIWVTDFGLATVLESEMLADPDDIGGTLRFMAPEQIAGKRDARSDVYSLGLTLYELLTSRPAFDAENRNTLVAKIVRGEFESPRSADRNIPRDLEAIVLKAAATTPRDRYDSAQALATDLRRFVHGRVVGARPMGPATTLWRWARRNPVVASLSGTLVVLCIASFLVIGAKWRDAVREGRRAESNLSVALTSMDRILEEFASSWMAHPLPGAVEDDDADSGAIEFQISVSNHNAKVLEDALLFYDEFARQNPDHSQLHLYTAKVHRRVADIYQRLGQSQGARDAYQRSLHFLREETDVDDSSVSIEEAGIRNQLGLSFFATSRFSEAEQQFRIADRLLSAHSDDQVSHAERARVLTNLGRLLALVGRRNEAVQCQQQALTLLESLVNQNQSAPSDRLALAQAHRNAALLAAFGRRHEQSELARGKAVEILETLVRDYPHVPDFRCELGDTLVFRVPVDDSERVDRVAELERSVKLARDLTDSYWSVPRYRVVLAHALKESARLIDHVDPSHADELFDESVSLYQGLAIEFDDVPVYHLFLSQALADHAANQLRLGNTSESLRSLQEAIKEQETFVRQRPDSRFGRAGLAILFERLAVSLSALNRHEEAAQARTMHDQLFRSRHRKGK